MATRSVGQSIRESAGLSGKSEPPPKDDTSASVTRTLVPEAGKVRIKIGDADQVLELRPMPVRFQRRIREQLDPIMREIDVMRTKGTTATLDDLDVLVTAQDSFSKALAVMGEFYNVPLTAEWIEENLSSSEIQVAVEAQLAVEDENDFLLMTSRAACDAIRGISSLLKQNLPQLRNELPPPSTTDSAISSSTQDSAKPGTARSTSSSPDTPASS